MQNPLRSEAEAFRFLLGAVVYFGLIAVAGVINAWAGLVVFLVLTAVVVWWWWRSRPDVVPEQGFAYLTVRIGDRLQHALPQVPRLVAIAQFHGLP